MRVLRKLLLVFCGVFLVLLSADEYVTVRQEIAQHERSLQDNLSYLAHVLQATTQHRWEEAGRDAALATLAKQELPGSGPRIRWLPRGSPADSAADRVHVAVPLEIGGLVQGSIELSQPRGLLEGYMSRRITQLTLLDLLVFAISVLVIYGVGTRLFGTRLERLVEQARRIGGGDLETRVDTSGQDESAVLGRQMNAMSDQLLASRAAIENAEAERLQALAQMRHADRLASIGRLSSVLAHELGTPLNVVLARSKLIAENPGEASEVVKNAEIVHGQAQRMTDAIRTTLGLARRGDASATVDIHEIARGELRLLEPLARRKGVRLSLAPAEGPSPVQARRAEIQQVVTNLVSNALDAVENGGSIELDVATVRAPPGQHRGGSFQRLSVRDDGCGIAEADLTQIFEAFHTSKGDSQGTGLGLWILDGIVRDHGGWIDVESRVGQGTLFRVYLPAAGAA
ncbi:MAG TPA: HAMP domain-containing sensor histidine kinase [Myxococcota bacterium]|nr:HAMP domain-containing sensor histidine kinase [Myxococcota bacterium]